MVLYFIMTLNEDVGNYNSIWFQNPGVLNFNNGLIANLLIASYDLNIWTDSYIRFLAYETQKAFFV